MKSESTREPQLLAERLRRISAGIDSEGSVFNFLQQHPPLGAIQPVDLLRDLGSEVRRYSNPRRRRGHHKNYPTNKKGALAPLFLNHKTYFCPDRISAAMCFAG